jgi:GT2 family glycosyltransferase
LERLLISLASQTRIPDEVIVADGSGADDIRQVSESDRWRGRDLKIKRIAITPPNAVKQRIAAIDKSHGDLLLLLDDDVDLDRSCVAELEKALNRRTEAVGVCANFSNQTWPEPTRAWRFYLKWVCGLRDGEWQGLVVGPLLRFGYNPPPNREVVMQWLGTGNSLVRRDAFVKAGGFSDFFLHRCTMNEDVDLGLKLGRLGQIYLCPSARLAHYHDPGGRVTPFQAAEDDIFNRYMVLYKTMGYSRIGAISQVGVFVAIESLSNILGSLKRGKKVQIGALLRGRIAGFLAAIRTAFRS